MIFINTNNKHQWRNYAQWLVAHSSGVTARESILSPQRKLTYQYFQYLAFPDMDELVLYCTPHRINQDFGCPTEILVAWDNWTDH